MANDAYKFPDEVEDKTLKAEGEELKVEIIDDTPPEDKGREPMPGKIVEALEKDDLEEYSDKVKTRFGQMKKVWHDERRAKESESREKDEALRLAQAYRNENHQLKQRLGQGEELFVAEVTKSAHSEVDTAKEKLRQAYDAGDAVTITDAQEALTDAKIKLDKFKGFKPSLQVPETGAEFTPQTQASPQAVDPKAKTWKISNTWFGDDEEMTALALGLHEKLVRSGVDPRSDGYYQRVDETMRKRFPEYEWEDGSQTPEPEKPQRKPASVVAPVTRSTAPRQVKLTATQVNLAKKLGLTNESYARELIKLENANG